MKAFRILRSSLSESFKGVFRNFSLSLASIFCITITLILVGLSIILSYNVNNFTKEIEQDMTIVVFLDRKSSEDDIESVKKSIEALDNIKEIEFQSKNDVKEQMQEDSEVFNSILAQYTDETNPLQDTYLVKVDDINLIGKTADKIEKIEKVDIVKYGEGSVEELVKIFNFIKKVMYVIVIALIVVTVFLIANTIKIVDTLIIALLAIGVVVGAFGSYRAVRKYLKI